MPVYRFEPHPVSITWAASGAINLELSPKPYTITRMAIIGRISTTTTTATNLNDYWDLIIARLNLTGRGKTFFDFSNLRIPYHLSRFAGFGPKRPTVVADSATELLQQYATIFHFGVAPFKLNPATGMLEDNPWDLTGGIPPVESGNLSLGGTFGAATARGTNVTTNSGQFDVYLWGVQPKAGDPVSAYMPRAFPVWSQRTPTPTATSSALATQDNIPAGDHLHSILGMATNGTGAPRDDAVLTSLSVYNQLEAREILRYGGQTGVDDDVKAAEILGQFDARLWLPGAPSDQVTTVMTAITSVNGVPAHTAASDSGLYWLPVHKFASGGHPLYGVDMRRVATGDLQVRYGVGDATGVTLDWLYRKYQLNYEHPLNAGA